MCIRDRVKAVSLEDITGYVANLVQEELAAIECFE